MILVKYQDKVCYIHDIIQSHYILIEPGEVLHHKYIALRDECTSITVSIDWAYPFSLEHMFDYLVIHPMIINNFMYKQIQGVTCAQGVIESLDLQWKFYYKQETAPRFVQRIIKFYEDGFLGQTNEDPLTYTRFQFSCITKDYGLSLPSPRDG